MTVTWSEWMTIFTVPFDFILMTYQFTPRIPMTGWSRRWSVMILYPPSCLKESWSDRLNSSSSCHHQNSESESDSFGREWMTTTVILKLQKATAGKLRCVLWKWRWLFLHCSKLTTDMIWINDTLTMSIVWKLEPDSVNMTFYMNIVKVSPHATTRGSEDLAWQPS